MPKKLNWNFVSKLKEPDYIRRPHRIAPSYIAYFFRLFFLS
jgi:hypothetical protein